MKRGSLQLPVVILVPMVLLAANCWAQAEDTGISKNRTYTRNNPSIAVSPPPCSTNGVSDPVPPAWVIEAVTQEASTRWTNFAVGQPIPCCNFAGELICYQVPVAVATNSFPNVLTPPPAAELPFDDLNSAQLWGVSEYWTFDVAASRSHYPIPHYGPGLPPLLVTYYKAAEIAQQQFAGARLALRHYYATGPTEQYYEFVSPSGSNVLINARTLSIRETPLGMGQSSAQPISISLTAEQKQRVESLRREHERTAQEAWDKIGSKIQSR